MFPLRDALLGMRRWGGAVIAMLLLLIGSIAGISGNIETWVYSTTFHMGLFMAHLPEIVVQTLAYGYLLLARERRVNRTAQRRARNGKGLLPRGPFLTPG